MLLACWWHDMSEYMPTSAVAQSRSHSSLSASCHQEVTICLIQCAHIASKSDSKCDASVMGNVKNESTFTGVQCCTELLTWIKPEFLQGLRWLTSIQMCSIVISVTSFLICEVEQVQGFRLKSSSGRILLQWSSVSKGLSFLSQHLNWALPWVITECSETAVHCFAWFFSEEGLWGEKKSCTLQPLFDSHLKQQLFTAANGSSMLCNMPPFLEAAVSNY